MRVKFSDEVRLKVTMPNGKVIIDSGPLDLVCANFAAPCPVSMDLDDAKHEIIDSLEREVPGCEVEFITDNVVWDNLKQRITDSEKTVFWR